MKKLLLEICKKHGYKDPPNRKDISLEMLIDGYLHGNVNVYVRELTGCAKQTATNAVKNAFPDKPSNNASTIAWLLLKESLIECSACKAVLNCSEFYTNTSNHYGYSSFCKECSKEARKESYRRNPTQERINNDVRKGRMHNMQTPSWADLNKIAEFYKNRPSGHHVDHIIPLNGKLVSGLHVENNLQYLSAEDNLAKNNKFIP